VPVHHRSPSSKKIALFRSLFRGRKDVYPIRFESRKTGRQGYSPACANEWVRDVCAKPKISCGACQHQRFLLLTDEVIRQHLAGKDHRDQDFVAGIYPMLQDETCFFLAIDMDKSSWREDASALLKTCRKMEVPAAIERSRSGDGAHIWIFFKESVPASLARRLGSHILTVTMQQHPDIGLQSYDRLFPNQDTLPKGGFGNLIALPLQKLPREESNSVFVDDEFHAYPDQWEFLSSIQAMSPGAVESLVESASKAGKVIDVGVVGDADKPWTLTPSKRQYEQLDTGELPEHVKLTLSNQIYIEKACITPELRNRLVKMAAFQNPEFYKAQAMRLSTWDKPRVISCAEDHPIHVGLPRGCIDYLIVLFERLKIGIDVNDCRIDGVDIDVSFQGELRPEQKTAQRKLLAHDNGVLAATTAFGKTVLAASMIADRGKNTLVLVHRKQLLDQWVTRLSEFLSVEKGGIGRIGGGRNKPSGVIDVATIQSLVRKGVVQDCVAEYGHLIVDECHHLSARSFELVAKAAKSRYVLGLSATVTRKDGHHPIIFMQCGPLRHRVDAKAAAANRPFEHSVYVRPTSFRPVTEADSDLRLQFQSLNRELMTDESRNELIRADILQCVRDGRSPLVLTERREHLNILQSLLEKEVQHTIVLQGNTGAKEIKANADRLDAISPAETRVLIATGRYIGEGFDDPRLDTLFLTLPISWRGTLAQYVGRLHRLYETKKEVKVYDYADFDVPMLSRMFDKRCAGYESIGYRVLLPGSAVPGWPCEVELPVDPQWKSDYAGTVRRLALDGVDAQLADLFVHTAREFKPDSTGVDRARSASEAFLYRRLQSLPATAGFFQLNAELPIPFDGWGNMEVDLLYPQGRLVIELDGGHHFSDKDAYRRDRRKDALLQQNGYFVLRFLVEDVGKQLDKVLDTITKAIIFLTKD